MNEYFCSECKTNSLTNESFIEIGTRMFYHHIRVELLGCACEKNAVGIYYFEEERHGHPDSEHHFGYFIDHDIYVEFQKIMKSTPETFEKMAFSEPYKFKQFLPISFNAELSFHLKAFQEQRHWPECAEHKRHRILMP